MPGNHLFEYAVIRVVPRVEREEFLNVGVILFCKEKNFLKTVFSLDEGRMRIFCESTDISDLKQHLLSFENISKGDHSAGPIARLDIASRFRWLTAFRSTIVQTSRVHSGLCEDPAEALNKLYSQLVG